MSPDSLKAIKWSSVHSAWKSLSGSNGLCKLALLEVDVRLSPSNTILAVVPALQNLDVVKALNVLVSWEIGSGVEITAKT